MHGGILKFWRADSLLPLLKLNCQENFNHQWNSFTFHSQEAERYWYTLAIPWQMFVQCTVSLHFYPYISKIIVDEKSRYNRPLLAELQTI